MNLELLEENAQNLNKKIIENIEEEEENLIEEEKLLAEELNQIQEKHKDVRLVYEKVTENIKNITKSDPKRFDDNSGFINNNSDFLNNSHLDSSENYLRSNVYDDELVKLYKDYLDSLKNTYQINFKDKDKNDLLEMLKDRKGNDSASSSRKNKKEKLKVRGKTINEKGSIKNMSKDNTYSSTIIAGYNEYEYSDEENIEDDKRMKEEYDQIVNNFKKKVKNILLYF